MVTDFKELLGRTLFFDAILDLDFTVEPAGLLQVPGAFLRFMEFMESLLLSDEPLPELSNDEREELSSFLLATEERKDLDGRAGLGKAFLEPPGHVFDAAAPLVPTVNQIKSEDRSEQE